MIRATLLLFLFSLVAFAQGYAPPDCQFTFTFTGTGLGSAAFNNKSTAVGGLPCDYWVLTYWNPTTVSAFSITLMGTNDNAGSAGASYTALTASQGTSNPATAAAQGTITAGVDYYPWINARVNTFTGTGTSTVRLYGWRGTAVSPGGSSGPTANVNVAQWGGTTTSLGQKAMAASVPVAIASDQSAIPVTVSGTQSVNLAQVGGNTVVTGGTNGSQGVGGLAASGATQAGNPVKIGGPFNTTQPTVTNGQAVDAQFSARGSFLVTPGVEGFPVTMAANSSVNVNQWGGAATTLGQKVSASSVPVVLASDQSSFTIGSNITAVNGTTAYGCGSQALFNLSGSGDTQIIALSGSTVIRICHIDFSTTAAEDVKLTTGTGSNCGTSTANLTGLWKSVQSAAMDYGPFSPLVGVAANAVCLNQSVAQALGGVVIYDQR